MSYTPVSNDFPCFFSQIIKYYLEKDVGDFVPLQYRTTSISHHSWRLRTTHTLYSEVYTGVKYVLMWSLKETIG